MSRSSLPSTVLALAVGVVGGLFALAGCADPAPDSQTTSPSAAGSASSTTGGGGEGGTALGRGDIETPLTPEEKVARAAESLERAKKRREEWDTFARGYLKSFESRVYSPARDSGLDLVEGTIKVRSGEQQADFRFRYDGQRKAGRRVTVTPTEDPEGMPAGTARTVLRWAKHSLEGAYRTVVYYLPPTQLSLVRSNEKGERLIVYCPPLKTDFSVSYSFDERELVTIRGTNGPQLKEITHFEWEFVRGRYFLDRLWFFGVDSEMNFEYGQRGGVVLLDRLEYRKKQDTLILDFTYSRVD